MFAKQPKRIFLRKFIVSLVFYSLLHPTNIFAADQKIRLFWDKENSPKVSYKTSIADISETNLLGFTGFDVSENPKLVDDAINIILDTTPTILQSRTVLSSLESSNFRVEMSYMEIDYEKPAENELEKMLRMRHKNMIGSVWLRGQIDSSGTVKSFYLPPAHTSILSQFFSLPINPVGTNDIWTVSVKLLKFGGDFQTNNQKRINQVSVVKLVKDSSDTIVTLFYNVSEYVQGGFRTVNDDELVPQTSVASLIAVGEFVVNKNYWRRFRGFLVEEQTGRINVAKTKLYSLEPEL